MELPSLVESQVVLEKPLHTTYEEALSPQRPLFPLKYHLLNGELQANYKKLQAVKRYTEHMPRGLLNGLEDTQRGTPPSGPESPGLDESDIGTQARTDRRSHSHPRVQDAKGMMSTYMDVMISH